MLEKMFVSVQVQVFEIDHPATQAFKNCRIVELGWEFPSQLNFISMDFTQENLAVVLKESSRIIRRRKDQIEKFTAFPLSYH